MCAINDSCEAASSFKMENFAFVTQAASQVQYHDDILQAEVQGAEAVQGIPFLSFLVVRVWLV